MSDDIEPYQEALQELKEGRTWPEVNDLLPVKLSDGLLASAADGSLERLSEGEKNSIALALLDDAKDCKRRGQVALNHAMQAIQRAREGGLTDDEWDEIMDGLKNFADTMT